MSETSVRPKQIPPAREGTVTVSKEAFFATVGRLNVHPHIRSGYDTVFGFRNEWKLIFGAEIVGHTYLDTHQSHGRFMVTEAFFNRNRQAIEAAEHANAAKPAEVHAVLVLRPGESAIEFQTRCAEMRREAMLALDVGNEGVIPIGGGPYAGRVVRLASATDLGLASGFGWREGCPYLPSDVCVLASWPFEVDSREMHPFDRDRLAALIEEERCGDAELQGDADSTSRRVLGMRAV